MSNELEQTHFVAGKVFVFQVPRLESSEGFKYDQRTHAMAQHCCFSDACADFGTLVRCVRVGVRCIFI